MDEAIVLPEFDVDVFCRFHQVGIDEARIYRARRQVGADLLRLKVGICWLVCDEKRKWCR